MTPPGWRLTVEESLESTQAKLVAQAEAGAPDRTAILAHRQTAGRGRQDRVWDSPQGNLHLSVLLRPSGPPREAPQWGLLAGVALAEAAAATDAEPAALRLKWPNDLLRHGAKAGGILAESQLAPGRIAWLVLGIGVNLAHAPRLDRPTAILAGAGSPQTFALRLIERLDAWRGIAEREGFAPVRAAWLALGPAPGDVLDVRAGPQHVRGRFAGLAEDGSLRLDTGNGALRIAAGEVAPVQGSD